MDMNVANGKFSIAKDHISIEVDAIDLDQRKSKCKIEEKYRVANFNVEQ